MQSEIRMRKAILLLFLLINLLNVPMFFMYYKSVGYWGILNIASGVFMSLMIALVITDKILEMFLTTVMDYKVYRINRYFTIMLYVVFIVAIVLDIFYVYNFVFMPNGNVVNGYNQQYIIFIALISVFVVSSKNYYISDSHTILKLNNRLMKVPNSDIFVRDKNPSRISSKMTTLELMAGGEIAYIEVLNEVLEEVQSKLS